MFLNQIFPLGLLAMTQGVHQIVQQGGFNPIAYLSRHARGDWGDLCDEDKRLNDQAVKDGGRVLSSYEITDQLKVWIITEWDRSVTTLLLPSEY